MIMFSLFAPKENVLATHSPVIEFLYFRRKCREAEQQLQRFVREDVYGMTGANKKYSVSFGNVSGYITVSTRDKLELITQWDYDRELDDKELYLLPRLGAMHGLDVIKGLDITRKEFRKCKNILAKLPLPQWLPYADYSDYAWNAGAVCIDNKKIIMPSPSNLDSLIFSLGHEAGHGFSTMNYVGEAVTITETFCDHFGMEYKKYFKREHAGTYTSCITDILPRQNSWQQLIDTVERTITEKGTEAAERFLQEYEHGLYNQAFLVHKKIYSGDSDICSRVSDLFSLYGPKAIHLVDKAPTKKRLTALHIAAIEGAELSDLLCTRL